MNTNRIFCLFLILAFVSACGQATPGATIEPTGVFPTTAPSATAVEVLPSPTSLPAPTDTAAPTGASAQSFPTQLALVVKTADRRIQIVNTTVTLTSAYNPAFTAINPLGGVINGVPYVYDFTTFPTVMVVGSDGPVQLGFVQNPTYGLAVHGGDQPRLAWATQLVVPNSPSSLYMAVPDSSQLETLLTQGANDPALQLVPLRFSPDGKSLYFSREPVGIGGYIVFPGVSSLYQVDVASKQVTDLVPFDLSAGSLCLDAISQDFRFVADHCTPNAITVRDLSAGTTTTILPPEGLTGYSLLGSACFSPDGSRVAYALAKNNPEAEQGWIAVSDSLQGGSQLVLAGSPGASYSVVGWLNEQTLLVQSSPTSAVEGADNQLWTVNIDGTNLTKVTDGLFLTTIQ